MISGWFKNFKKFQTHQAETRRLSRAVTLAREDWEAPTGGQEPRFSIGSRPVIRWIKGDGLDDEVTRAAIGQATRLFGSSVDYCLCTHGIEASRARSILKWASQPVEWWPVSPRDNPLLSELLSNAGCPPENYGYWWKWFPERVRPDAPEWILDGDMVITGKPSWFKKWTLGCDPVRISQDDRWPAEKMYGRYLPHVDENLKFYSGLISLPPGLRYMKEIFNVLKTQPLHSGHNGCRDMCEQGVVAAAFQKLQAKPIPLCQFPFARAFEAQLDYGLQDDRQNVWGYHFGNAFRRHNPHFKRMTEEGILFSKSDTGTLDRFLWLGAQGQWGIPGWSMPDHCLRVILEHARIFSGKKVLELGTSRGRLSATLADIGCTVLTVDHQDRGASQNLEGLQVQILQNTITQFLSATAETFDLIVIDLHGNSTSDWETYEKPLLQCLNPGGLLLLNNAALHEIPEWSEETGVAWFLKRLPVDWKIEIDKRTPPGIAIVTRPHLPVS